MQVAPGEGNGESELELLELVVALDLGMGAELTVGCRAAGTWGRTLTVQSARGWLVRGSGEGHDRLSFHFDTLGQGVRLQAAVA